jgi:hypothetical protein
MASQRTHDDDDGRTIADMSDVRTSSPLLPHDVSTLAQRLRAKDEPGQSTRDFSDELQDSEERLMVILGTLRAALSIGLVYVVAFGIIIALMVALWT